MLLFDDQKKTIPSSLQLMNLQFSINKLEPKHPIPIGISLNSMFLIVSPSSMFFSPISYLFPVLLVIISNFSGLSASSTFCVDIESKMIIDRIEIITPKITMYLFTTSIVIGCHLKKCSIWLIFTFSPSPVFYKTWMFFIRDWGSDVFDTISYLKISKKPILRTCPWRFIFYFLSFSRLMEHQDMDL